MLYLVGNGTSRKDLDLDTLGEWWGFNMIYTTHTPDLVFCGDVYPQHKIIEDEYYKTNKVVMGEWNELPIDAWEMIKMGIDSEAVETRRPDDNAFVMQSEFSTRSPGDVKYYFTGYSTTHQDNIVIYKKPEFKNMLSGMYALGYAVDHGYKEICLVGYDSLQFDQVENVFKGQYNYRDNYTHHFDVGDVQKAQFIALLEYINKEYPNVELYFKNPIDGFDRIKYTDIVSRFNVEDKWILGQGLESLDKMLI